MGMDLRVLRYFVAVAEERHVGRAAARLHMTQPPLSRAIRALEAELGALLLVRSSTGVELTGAGTVLLDEARTLLEQAEQLRTRVGTAGGAATFTVGVLADSAEQAGAGLAATFRRQHPHVQIQLRESDFTDPSAGLRSGAADVALTRTPFDTTGIRTVVLRSDPVGVVLRTDDPLAGHSELHLPELTGRRWFQLPVETDPLWRAYWRGLPVGDGQPEGPVVRTIHECLQAVLWTDSIGLTPLGHTLPDGLTTVALADFPPSDLVVAWSRSNNDPLVRSFTRMAALNEACAR